MPISVTCSCGKKLRAKDELAGKRVKCPACGTVMALPIAAAPVPKSLPPKLQPPTQKAPPVRPAPKPVSQKKQETIPVRDEGRAEPAIPAPPVPSAKPARKRKRKKRRPAAIPEAASTRDYLYWILLLAFIPLAFSLLQKDTRERRIERIEQAEAEGEEEAEDQIAALPETKAADPHLSRDSWMHWAYAVLAAAGFLGLFLVAFPRGNASHGQVALVGLFTATVGIILLLAFHWCTELAQRVRVRGRGILVVIWLILLFFAFSYSAAVDPRTNFVWSLLGFTFGVGLCEEICKALPLIVHFRGKANLNWHAACLWGLASGAGFGVSEGIMYSSSFYNGFSTWDIYVVRFVSCVALHAIWSASVGIAMFRYQSLVNDSDSGDFWLGLLMILAVPMLLHGLYDTLLKKEMNLLALVSALVSFGWLVWQIERVRRKGQEQFAFG